MSERGLPQNFRIDTGCLLAAWPQMQDPNFSHSVILIVGHQEQGAVGLMVNRCLDATIDRLLPDHPVLGGLSTPVHLGGPVETERLQFLHAHGDQVPGGQLVVPGVWLGGDLDRLADLLARSEGEGEPPARVRLIVGYSGWGAGQLENELSEGAWLPAPYSAAPIFETDGESTWRAVVRSVEGGDELSSTPPDVDWN